jgi:hypothetical protein
MKGCFAMTKKHFIALADLIKASACVLADPSDCEPNTFAEGYAYGRREQLNETTEFLADFCHSQNSNFNRARWLAHIAGECGPSGGKQRL